MKTIPNSFNFETSDLNLAAFLKANKIPLVSTRRQQNKVFFGFNHPDIQSIAMQYFNNGKVSASSYARALSELKTLIFQGT